VKSIVVGPVTKIKLLMWNTLENRRLRCDMIHVFKLIKGFDFVAPHTFFKMPTTGLRGHTFR